MYVNCGISYRKNNIYKYFIDNTKTKIAQITFYQNIDEIPFLAKLRL